MIKALGKLIAGINGNQRPGEIAGGFACGVFLGLLPGGNLFWWLFFLLFALVKIHKGAFLLSLLLSSLLLSFIDPLLHRSGYALLTAESLYPLWSWFAGQPLAGFTRFNNSLVMGALAFGLPIWLISYVLSRLFLQLYRRVIRDRFIRPKLIPWLKKIPLVKYVVVFFETLARAAEAAWH